MFHTALKSVLSVVLAVAASFAAAQEWPGRPVKFIVPVPPGGGTDLYARVLAQTLSDSLKQPFVVENRPGAGGNIGAEAVVKSPPDGYTFFVSATGTMVVNPSLYRDLPFSLENDFLAVARGVTGPFVFISNSGLPFRNLSDLIGAARSKQGGLAFASAGTGSMTYLGVRMLEEAADVRFLNVPYKGMGQAYQDLIGGQVNFVFVDVASALPHIRGGKVRALAVTSKTPLLPETPTVADAGFRGFNANNSFSVFARVGTPSAIVHRANAEINNAMRTPSLATKLEANAMVPVFESSDEFAESLKRERRDWAAFIQRNGIRLEQ